MCSLHIFVNCYVDGLRQRGGATAPASDSDLDSILQHHQQMQEKLAEEMVQLARNMKDHAKAASNIVQDDNKVSIDLRVTCLV
ncbi:USE1 [Bugula neritina]|uniref:Vesicle transport protein USE1 n=1 Tax=Bugula neritina TaxID=10212 RepID=A0A7J7IVQ0_BUGNE|nr:USE1 [Bugula neritina]